MGAGHRDAGPDLRLPPADPREHQRGDRGGTGLYPSTVRDALAGLHAEENVQRRKRSASGAGNNPYEYTAIALSDLVGAIVEDVQDELNTVFDLDAHLGVRAGERREPVNITVGDGYDARGNAAGERDD